MLRGIPQGLFFGRLFSLQEILASRFTKTRPAFVSFTGPLFLKIKSKDVRLRLDR